MHQKKIPLVLFNCTTNNVGGGMKNASLFIEEAMKGDPNIEWRFAISEGVRDTLRRRGIGFDHRFSIFEHSPARSRKAQNALKQLAEVSNADLVFTMAGPAYVKFQNYHILGLSSAYITHPNWSVISFKRSLKEKIKLLFHISFQIFHSTRADFFIFQTNEARENFSKNTRINISRTAVVSNAFDARLLDVLSGLDRKHSKNRGVVTIFCPGAAYDHKGFQFIPRIAFELSKLTSLPFEFVLTLPESPLLNEINQEIKRLKISSFIRNIGPFHYSDIADLYSNADVVFVPSLLETFSASYLEAMTAKKVLVVADKGFSRDICKDAAVYVNPIKPVETAMAFLSIIESPDKFEDKIQLGEEISKSFGDQHQRYQKIADLLVSKYTERLALKK